MNEELRSALLHTPRKPYTEPFAISWGSGRQIIFPDEISITASHPRDLVILKHLLLWLSENPEKHATQWSAIKDIEKEWEIRNLEIQTGEIEEAPEQEYPYEFKWGELQRKALLVHLTGPIKRVISLDLPIWGDASDVALAHLAWMLPESTKKDAQRVEAFMAKLSFARDQNRLADLKGIERPHTLPEKEIIPQVQRKSCAGCKHLKYLNYDMNNPYHCVFETAPSTLSFKKVMSACIYYTKKPSLWKRFKLFLVENFKLTEG